MKTATIRSITMLNGTKIRKTKYNAKIIVPQMLESIFCLGYFIYKIQMYYLQMSGNNY